MIKGRDLVSGLPKQEKIPIQIVEEKAHSQVRDICVQVKAVLESITPELAPCYRTSLQFISLEFAHGFRLHELLILKTLLDKDSVSIDEFKIQIEKFGFSFDNDDIDGAMAIHIAAANEHNDIVA